MPPTHARAANPDWWPASSHADETSWRGISVAGRYVIHGRKVAYNPVKEPLVDEQLDEAFEMHECERDGMGASALRGIAG